MAFHQRKPKVDKSPFTLYTSSEDRNWADDFYQVVSIDPASVNYALRIERRYATGKIVTLVFTKTSLRGDENVFTTLTNFLDQFTQHYTETHMVIIERQLPQNYKATRIAQHTLTYFLLRKDMVRKPFIVEVDPQLKGRQLGATKGISSKQLKAWAVEKARELLTIRNDTVALTIMQSFRTKQDDLADTVCQIEGLFSFWNLPLTAPPRKVTLNIT